MNGTIVRRIDDLGRIVIPKELRKTLRIREGDEIEISPDGEKLILSKYSPFDGMSYAAMGVAKMIGEYIPGSVVYIVASDKVIATFGKGAVKGGVPSGSLQKIISARSSVVLSGLEVGELFEKSSAVEGYIVAEPILVNGDLLGTIIVTRKTALDENQLGYISFASAVLGAVVAGQ